MDMGLNYLPFSSRLWARRSDADPHPARQAGHGHPGLAGHQRYLPHLQCGLCRADERDGPAGRRQFHEFGFHGRRNLRPADRSGWRTRPTPARRRSISPRPNITAITAISQNSASRAARWWRWLPVRAIPGCAAWRRSWRARTLPDQLDQLAHVSGDKGFEALFEIRGQQGTDLSEKLVKARGTALPLNQKKCPPPAFPSTGGGRPPGLRRRSAPCGVIAASVCGFGDRLGFRRLAGLDFVGQLEQAAGDDRARLGFFLDVDPALGFGDWRPTRRGSRPSSPWSPPSNRRPPWSRNR